MRERLAVLATVAFATFAAAAPAGAAEADNPCQGPERKELLCPNLRIGPATELYVDQTGAGNVLLRATSDVRSRGRGPIELIGHRNGYRTMRTNQRIYKVGGGHITVQSDATLRFTDVGAYWGGAYWKVHQLAQFDLRPVNADGTIGEPVRTSPKLNYCLRDLTRTQASAASPPARHYPGCNQNPYRGRVTLGTSVGWSDIYPAPYHQQWINVAGLRGCYVYEMTVDPKELLHESNEKDNSSQIRVQLPYTGARC